MIHTFFVNDFQVHAGEAIQKSKVLELFHSILFNLRPEFWPFLIFLPYVKSALTLALTICTLITGPKPVCGPIAVYSQSNFPSHSQHIIRGYTNDGEGYIYVFICVTR